MNPEILNSIAAFAAYFLGGLGFIFLFVFIYLHFTPYAELKLIREGHSSAAISLGGAIVGFTLPLSKSIEQAHGPGDMMVWSLIALVTQLGVFILATRLFPKMAARIQSNEKAEAVFLCTISITIGLLNAACMTE